MNALGDILNVMGHIGRKQVGSGVKKIHCAIDAYAHIHIVSLGETYHIVHVLKSIPWREAKHQRDWNLVP